MNPGVKQFVLLLAGFFSAASPLLAATEAADSGGSLLFVLFIGFFALIVVFQLVPACLMFIGMVKGMVGRQDSRQRSSTADR
jgi:hypothetical protein